MAALVSPQWLTGHHWMVILPTQSLEMITLALKRGMGWGLLGAQLQ